MREGKEASKKFDKKTQKSQLAGKQRYCDKSRTGIKCR